MLEETSKETQDLELKENSPIKKKVNVLRDRTDFSKQKRWVQEKCDTFYATESEYSEHVLWVHRNHCKETLCVHIERVRTQLVRTLRA